MKTVKKWYIWWLSRAGQWTKSTIPYASQVEAEDVGFRSMKDKTFMRCCGLASFAALAEGDQPVIGEIAG